MGAKSVHLTVGNYCPFHETLRFCSLLNCDVAMFGVLVKDCNYRCNRCSKIGKHCKWNNLQQGYIIHLKIAVFGLSVNYFGDLAH